MKKHNSRKNSADKIWDLKVEIFSVLFGILATYLFFGSNNAEGTNTTIINHWYIGEGLMNIVWGGIILVAVGVLGRIIYILSKVSDIADAVDTLDDVDDATDLFDLF